jgi:hypothetical protein
MDYNRHGDRPSRRHAFRTPTSGRIHFHKIDLCPFPSYRALGRPHTGMQARSSSDSNILAVWSLDREDMVLDDMPKDTSVHIRSHEHANMDFRMNEEWRDEVV